MRAKTIFENLETRRLLSLAVGLRGDASLLFFDTDSPGVE
jgi:hypothetical protein